MALEPETLKQLVDTVRRFVRERLVPLEHEVAENDAVPPEIIEEMRAWVSSASRSRRNTAASASP